MAIYLMMLGLFVAGFLIGRELPRKGEPPPIAPPAPPPLTHQDIRVNWGDKGKPK